MLKLEALSCGYGAVTAVSGVTIEVSRGSIFSLFPRLAERRAQLAGSLSGGEQQMLAFGRALMAEPRLLFVDELSLGLMPKAIGLFIDVLRKLRGEGVTIVLVEQNTRRALQIA